jgi:chromosome segregation ATPase
MAKVKIQTSLASNFGCEVSFGDLVLHFDKLGIAEVESQSVAEKLADNYEGWIFIGEAPKKKAADKGSDIETKELQAELDRLTDRVEAREATIKALENECKEWKDQVNLYKEKAEAAEAELSGFKEQSDKVVKELELKVALTVKTSAELIEFCKTLEIPEERYKGVTKADLITIILDESRSK